MNTVFEIGDADWRGIGTVLASGLQIKPRYEKYDADKNFDIKTSPAREPKGCICGAILRGVSTPQDCKLFRVACTPERPVGPCMVSSEGSCAAYFQYEVTSNK
jgi:hydrogenase expression/formation protein HypD